MQVLIRRKGLILTAEWDGLAKPEGRSLQYWFRVAPDLPIANPERLAAIDASILSRVVRNTTRSFQTEAQPQSTTALMTGAWGGAVREAGLAAVGKSTLSAAQSPLVGVAVITPANKDSAEITITRWLPNVLKVAQAIEQAASSSVVPQNRPLSGAGGRPTLVFGAPANSHAGSNYAQHGVTVRYAPNLLRLGASTNGAQAVVESVVGARQGTLPLKAPLPSGARFVENVSAYEAHPTATDPRQLEQLVVIDDPARHTQWSRTPRPTHLVVDSQTPAYDPEMLRRSAPTVEYVGFRGVELETYYTHSLSLVETGAGAPLRPHGDRGTVCQYNTNGLSDSAFSASGYSGSSYDVRGAFDGWSFNGTADLSGAAQVKWGSSAWRVNNRNDQWVQIDFGRVVEGLYLIRIQGDVSLNSAMPNSLMRRITLKVSDDGVNWTDHVTFDTVSATGTTGRSFTPVTTRYVRLHCHYNWGHSTYTSLCHVELYTA